MSAAAKWTPIFPVPEGTPRPRFTHSHRGEALDHYEFRNAQGATLGYVCLFVKSTGETVEQTLTWCRDAEGVCAWRFVQFPKLRPLYGLDELARMPAPYPVLLVFDCASASAARAWLPHYPCVAWPGGVRAIEEVDFSPLRDRWVLIVPNAGAVKACGKLAQTLRNYACTVQPVEVTVSPERPEGWNFGLAGRAGYTAAEAEALITAASRVQTPPGVEKKKAAPDSNAQDAGSAWGPDGAGGDEPPKNGFPIIDWREGELPRVVDEAEAALLAGDVPIFQRTGMLVRVVTRQASSVRLFRRPPGSLGLVMVDKSHLVETLTRVATWRRWDTRSEGWRRINASAQAAETYLARVGGWKLPRLRAVISTPTLRPDGTLLQDPGYDAATQVWYDPLGESFERIKDKPTLDDAGEALDVLLAAFKTFPFVDRVDLSVALSLALTALVRRSLPSAPLGGITAPAARSGKTKLAHCIAVLAMGTPAPAMSYPIKEDEAAKSALALLLDGDAAALIDNITRPLQGDWLCQILTEEEFKQRELGASKMVRVPTNVLFLATGNHLQITGDLRSRSLLCRLDAKVERPEERRFEQDAVDVFLARRSELVVAGLTIMRAFIAQGVKQEDIGVSPWGGFERWSAMVRAPLIWVGCKDPRLSHDALMDEDGEHADLMRMLECWQAVFGTEGVTVRESIAKVSSAVTSEEEKALGQVMRDVAKDRAGVIDVSRLASWLRRHSKLQALGKQIVKAGERDHVILWKVETVNTS